MTAGVCNQLQVDDADAVEKAMVYALQLLRGSHDALMMRVPAVQACVSRLHQELSVHSHDDEWLQEVLSVVDEVRSLLTDLDEL